MKSLEFTLRKIHLPILPRLKLLSVHCRQQPAATWYAISKFSHTHCVTTRNQIYRILWNTSLCKQCIYTVAKIPCLVGRIIEKKRKKERNTESRFSSPFFFAFFFGGRVDLSTKIMHDAVASHPCKKVSPPARGKGKSRWRREKNDVIARIHNTHSASEETRTEPSDKYTIVQQRTGTTTPPPKTSKMLTTTQQ